MADVQMTEAPVAEDATANTSTTENATATADSASSPTLYIKNLNEKIKLDVLKKSLKALFGQYGEVQDIVAHSNIRMRGQAFVIFEDKEVAAKALLEVQGFPLYGKPMNIQFSKTKSDVHAKNDGDFDEHYKRRMQTKEQFANEFKPKVRAAKLRAKQQQQLAQEQQRLMEEKQHLLQQQQQLAQQPHLSHAYPSAAGAAGAAVPMVPDEYLPRNSILFLQNLPHDLQESVLVSLFQQYPGFKEVRTVPGKSGIAFVEYDNEYYSAAAKTALADYQITPDHKMKVTFARK
ncbi:hypothetical protein BGX28_006613 [Mortierella sp. GBA30]|nr:hypothetical protein BGX28_006613 [Mortierella sp. GBA30]